MEFSPRMSPIKIQRIFRTSAECASPGADARVSQTSTQKSGLLPIQAEGEIINLYWQHACHDSRSNSRSNVGLDLQSKNSHKTRFWNSGVSQLVQYVWWFDQKGMLRQIRYGVVPQCPLFCINSGDVMRGGEGGGTEHETGNVLRGARLKLVDLYFSSWLTPHFSQLSFPHVKWSNITFQPPPFPYSAVHVPILWNTIF